MSEQSPDAPAEDEDIASTRADDADWDPVMSRIFLLPLPIAATYVLVAAGIAFVVRWRGVTGASTPAWLWMIWLVLLGPVFVSSCWRAVRRIKAHAPVEDDPL